MGPKLGDSGLNSVLSTYDPEIIIATSDRNRKETFFQQQYANQVESFNGLEEEKICQNQISKEEKYK